MRAIARKASLIMDHGPNAMNIDRQSVSKMSDVDNSDQLGIEALAYSRSPI